MNEAEVDLVPETCAEALEKWDRGEPVFTVEMGGIGPGYEQCIQILVFELIRAALAGEMPVSGTPMRGWGEATVTRLNDALGGFSGAQVGAAKSLAAAMLINGYRAAVRSVDGNRMIQASKNFPALT